jgi:hypothetical protein
VGRVIDLSQITAVLHTRGDTDLGPILDSLLPYGEVKVWNPSRRDVGVYGRYQLVRETSNPVIYLQDDDVIVPPETQRALIDAYEPGVLVASWGHGDTPCGYEDVALVHGGALVDRDLPGQAFARYLDHFPYDDDFEREADMVSGCLTPHRQLRLPFSILPVASAPSRMCNQEWQREKKMRVTNRCRWIRDHASGGASRTESMSTVAA